MAVYYGSDIDSTTHGRRVKKKGPSGVGMVSTGCGWQRFSPSLSSICSGFSKNLADAYGNFAWNLNVLPGMPHSVLKHVEGISGRAGGGVCASRCRLLLAL
jgi:hypothetical protein